MTLLKSLVLTAAMGMGSVSLAAHNDGRHSANPHTGKACNQRPDTTIHNGQREARNRTKTANEALRIRSDEQVR